MKHPFPWSQPASPLPSLCTQAASRALSYDIAELIMLLYWFWEALRSGGGEDGWAQPSLCAEPLGTGFPALELLFWIWTLPTDQAEFPKVKCAWHILSLMSWLCPRALPVLTPLPSEWEPWQSPWNTILWLDSAPLGSSSRRCWGLWAREVWSEMHVCRNGWGFPFA